MKPAVILSGFFGRSNVGDEAILQVLYEQFRSEFRPIIAVDHHGAVDKFWDAYPYRECEIIGQSDRSACAGDDVVGFHAGGGGLGVGLPYNQLFYALSQGRNCVVSGIDFHDDYAQLGTRHRQLTLGLVRACAFFSVRGAASLVNASSVGVELHHGADWAYSLQVEEPGRSLVASDQALVVIREPDARNFDLWAMRQQCLGLLEGLDRLGYGTALLPFSPGDERFSETLALDRPILSHWTSPRRVKGLLADAALCVSVGRLHPLILAHSAGTPTIYVSLDAAIGGFVGAKIRDLCAELAIPFLPVNLDVTLSSDALATAISMARATAGPAADVLARWSDMRGRVIAALAGERQPSEVDPSPIARSVARS